MCTCALTCTGVVLLLFSKKKREQLVAQAHLIAVTNLITWVIISHWAIKDRCTIYQIMSGRAQVSKALWKKISHIARSLYTSSVFLFRRFIWHLWLYVTHADSTGEWDGNCTRFLVKKEIEVRHAFPGTWGCIYRYWTDDHDKGRHLSQGNGQRNMEETDCPICKN